MGIWRNAVMEYGTFGVSERERVQCEVRLSRGELIVSYRDERGPVLYRGQEDGGGHFRLTSPERSGGGTLHRFPGGGRLEGLWHEGGYEGWWFVELGEQFSERAG